MPTTLPLLAVPQLTSRTISSAPAPADPHRNGQSGASSAVARDFEAFVLQSFIEAMLPENTDSVLGTGTAGAFWKSMLAEQVARELASAGGIGIARIIEAEMAARSGDS